jgi:serine/threonine protein kinase/WD40 repeat protein
MSQGEEALAHDGAAIDEPRVFQEALSLSTDDERRSYLDETCRADPAMRTRVLQLLAAYEQDKAFLSGTDDVSFLPPPKATGTSLLGTTLGPYKLLSILGEGGMGVVYLAEQQAPIKRRVAIKLIKPGMDSQQVLARFGAERQALALMDHPHIARVFDADTSSGGYPYFAMEYIHGQPITEFCDQFQLGITERLQLFQTVCEAIQHAHQKGVIHRDIKPSNVLVSMVDRKPVPKIIDFGIAKAVDGQFPEAAASTIQGQLVGTLDYMAPEQVRRDRAAIDTRTDVYALGALLYELVSGKPPFEPMRLRIAPLDELIRIISYETPRYPSDRRRRELELSGSKRLSRLTTRLLGSPRNDLDWVVMKAIAKSPGQRYVTPQALADDVGRYLRNEAIQAKPPRPMEQTWRWIRRRPLVAALIGVVAASTFALAALEIQYGRRLKASLDATQSLLYGTRINFAWRAREQGDYSTYRKIVDEYGDGKPLADFRGSEWHYLTRLTRRDYRQVTRLPLAIYSICRSKDGSTVAAGGGKPQVYLFDYSDGRLIDSWDTEQYEVNSVLLSADGKTLWTAGDDGCVCAWNLPGHSKKYDTPTIATEKIFNLLVDENRKLLFGCGTPHSILIWNSETGEPVGEMKGHTGTIQTIVWSPDRKHIASASDDNDVRLWDATTFQSVQTYTPTDGPNWKQKNLAFSSDGETLFSATGRDWLIAYEVKTGRQLARHSFPDSPHGIAVSPEADRVAVVDARSNFSVLREEFDKNGLVTALTPTTSWSGGESQIRTLLPTDGGRRLLTGARDGWIAEWEVPWLSAAAEVNLRTGDIWNFAFQENSTSIVTVGDGVRFLTLDGEETKSLDRSASLQQMTSVESAGLLAVGGHFDVFIHKKDSSDPPVTFRTPWKMNELALTHDGRSLVIASDRENEILIVSPQTGEEQTKLSLPDTYLARCSPTDRILAATVQMKRMEVFRLGDPGSKNSSPRKLWETPTYEDDVHAIEFSPDGRFLFTGHGDRMIRMWDVATGRTVREFRGVRNRVGSLSVSPDGRTLASIDRSNYVSLWHIATGQLLFDTPTGSTTTQGSKVCRFSPDGKWLAFTFGDTAIRMLRLE